MPSGGTARRRKHFVRKSFRLAENDWINLPVLDDCFVTLRTLSAGGARGASGQCIVVPGHGEDAAGNHGK